MSKHAPGPWYADHDNASTAIRGGGPSSPSSTTGYRIGDKRIKVDGVEYVRADIADEMMAAMKAIVAVDGPGMARMTVFGITNNMYRGLAEAIKKAEGET